MNFQRMNETLKSLAKTDSSFPELPTSKGFTHEDLMQALNEVRRVEQKKEAVRSARAITNVSMAADDIYAAMAIEVELLKKKTDATLAKMVEIARASQYAVETGNYLPLALLVREAKVKQDAGFAIEVKATIASKVPEDWVPLDKADLVKGHYAGIAGL